MPKRECEPGTHSWRYARTGADGFQVYRCFRCKKLDARPKVTPAGTTRGQ